MSKSKQLPWEPAEYDAPIVTAVQHLIAGECEPHLQKKFMEWLILECCDTYGMSFRPDDKGGHDAMVFAEAKRYIGNQIIKMSKLKPGVVAGNSEPRERG
jgi:hypothetical protein